MKSVEIQKFWCHAFFFEIQNSKYKNSTWLDLKYKSMKLLNDFFPHFFYEMI